MNNEHKDCKCRFTLHMHVSGARLNRGAGLLGALYISLYLHYYSHCIYTMNFLEEESLTSKSYRS